MALRRSRDRRRFTMERQPDALPKAGLFTEPIRVTRLEALEVETMDDGRHRATFLAEVKDADDKRCSDVAVEARMRGPERTATVFGTTDLLGRIRFRMAGPLGAYRITITDVGAHGLRWDPDAGPRDAAVTVSDGPA